MVLERSNRRRNCVDIPNLVRRAQSGDDEAMEEIDNYLRPRLLGFFRGRLPNQAQDLTQETLTGVCLGLPRFDPRLGRKSPAGNFDSWTFAIARAALNAELRVTMRQTSMLQNDAGTAQNENPIQPENLMPKFQEKLIGLLSPKELEIVTLRMEGKELAEIAEEVGHSYWFVRARLTHARSTIERQIMDPVGLKKVAGYKNRKLAKAAASGTAKAFKFLGFYYTTDEWVQAYEQNKFTPECLAVENLVVLSESVTPDEYGTLMGSPRYRKWLRKEKGRVCISQENLNEFRNQRRKSKKRIKSPGEEYVPLKTFATTIAQYHKLNTLAKKGKLPAVKEGSWWFVKPQDVENLIGQK